MKKLLLVVCVAFALTSCKHDYKCECTALGFTVSETYPDLTKKESKDKETECDKNNTEAKTVGGSCKFGKA